MVEQRETQDSSNRPESKREMESLKTIQTKYTLRASIINTNYLPYPFSYGWSRGSSLRVIRVDENLIVNKVPKIMIIRDKEEIE